MFYSFAILLASKLGCEVELLDGFTLTIEDVQKYPE
jgi:hypothetical protein